MNRQETLRWIERIPPCAGELAGEDIVFLSHQRWNTHFTPVHGTVLRLAQRNRVLYMEPPDSIAWIRHQPAARRALIRTFDRVEVVNDNLTIYHTPPLFLPLQAKSRAILKSLHIIYRWMIQDGMRRMGVGNPVLWIFQFNVAAIVDSLHPKLTLYECAEEAAEFAKTESLRRYVRNLDAELCRRADVVIVPNPHMLEARKDLCRDIHMHPWPADVEHYGQAMNPDLPVPEDIARIARPIVGFYGMIDPLRLDVDLLLAVARRNPNWNFVLIGGHLQNYDPKPLNALPNIHRLGMKPLEQLPAYVKAFDVCTVPYVLNGFTRSITPLKYAEYLSTGKPVVTTALPAAEMYKGVLRVAHNEDEFEALIAESLSAPDTNVDKRLQVARENNWDNYMQRKTAIVASHLRKTARQPVLQA